MFRQATGVTGVPPEAFALLLPGSLVAKARMRSIKRFDADKAALEPLPTRAAALVSDAKRD